MPLGGGCAHPHRATTARREPIPTDPALDDRCHLSGGLAVHSPWPWREATKPNQMLLRAVIAMTLVRIRTGYQWTDCAALLGITPAKGRSWTRYAFFSRFGSLKADLLRAANHVGGTVHHQPGPSPWASRPEPPDSYGTTPRPHPRAALGVGRFSVWTGTHASRDTARVRNPLTCRTVHSESCPCRDCLDGRKN